MDAHFYLGKKNENNKIFSLYGISAPPYKKDDKLILKIKDLVPNNYNEVKHTDRHNLLKTHYDCNETLKDKFHLKEIEIFEVKNYAEFNITPYKQITVEYYCKIV